MEQNIVYCKMRELPPEQYTIVRKFIVKHPVCSQKEIRQFKMKQQNSIPEIEKILSDAYENIPEGSYGCPECGWTMQFHGYQAVCCNPSCAEHHPQNESLSHLSTDDMRLIHGVMRYMSLSGKLELEIQEKAEKSGCKTILYPNCDEYDVQITLPNGTIWAIDAKTHQSPYILANQIKQDSFLQMFRRISGFMSSTKSERKNSPIIAIFVIRHYKNKIKMLNVSLKTNCIKD